MLASIRLHPDHSRYPQDGNTCSLPDVIYPNNPRPAPDVFSSLLDTMEGLSKVHIHSANECPIEHLLPLIRVMEVHFLQQMMELQRTFEGWKAKQSIASSRESSGMATLDKDLAAKWLQGRGTIEQFQVMHHRIADFAETMISPSGSRTLVPRSSKYFENSMSKQQRLLQKGRDLEQHVRDAIQVNIGNLSLQESRKSIQQADSIGRISFLGFIFLPLLLVMSFFGMNIRQITGSGASYRTFLVSSALMCVVVVAVCTWLWRKSKRVQFIALIPVVIVTFLILAPLYCIMLLFGSVWREMLGIESWKRATTIWPCLWLIRLHITLWNIVIRWRQLVWSVEAVEIGYREEDAVMFYLPEFRSAD